MDTPPLPRRKTIRLQNYDYSQNGAYFVTARRTNAPCSALSVGATLAVAHLDRPMWNTLRLEKLPIKHSRF